MPIIDPNVKRLYNERYQERRRELAKKKREERTKVGSSVAALPDNVAEDQFGTPVPNSNVRSPDPPPPSPLTLPEPEVVMTEDEYIQYLKKRETPSNSEGLIQKLLKAGLVTLIPQLLQILSSAASKTISDRSNTETHSKSSPSQPGQKPGGLSIAFS